MQCCSVLYSEIFFFRLQEAGKIYRIIKIISIKEKQLLIKSDFGDQYKMVLPIFYLPITPIL